MSTTADGSTKKVKAAGHYEPKSGHQPRSLERVYLAAQRTSLSSYRVTNTAKKEEPVVEEPESSSVFSTALEYIISPVKYIASVIKPAAVVPPKTSPLKLKNQAGYKLVNKPRQSLSPAPIPTSRMSLNDIETRSSSMDTIEMIRSDLAMNVKNKGNDKTDKPEDSTPANKKGDATRSSLKPAKVSMNFEIYEDNASIGKKANSIRYSQTSSKVAPRSSTVSYKTFHTKKQSPSPIRKSLHNIIPQTAVSASNVKIATSNHFSFRITSTEKIQAVIQKPKRVPKKVFKIDNEKNKTFY